MTARSGGFIQGLDQDEPASAIFLSLNGHGTQGPAGPGSLPTAVVFHGLNGHFIRTNDASVVVIYRYQMRAQDANCPGTTRTWIVTGAPDFTASQYMGSFCGGSVNFTDIHVQKQWLIVQV